jgi:Ubiquitin interaction motif
MGPTDPITGGTSAIIGTVSTTMMGVADMPIETLKALHIHPETREKIKAKAKQHSYHSKGKGKNIEKDNSSTITAESKPSDSNSTQSKPEALTSQSNLVTSPTVMSPLASESNLSSQFFNPNSETASMMTTTTNTSTQFEPLSETGSPHSSIILSTPTPSGPTSPSPRTRDSYLSIPESESTERGRSTDRQSAMADALHALNDPSGSPSRFRRKSPSTSPSRASGSHSLAGQQHSRSSSFSSRCREASQSISSHLPLENSSAVTLDTLYGTSKGIGRIVGAGLRSPMDFTMAISKGFHNLPRMYGEEPRQVDRVTDLGSGFRTAGKEFGYGLFDGIAGLVTQPIQGAKKEGASGFLKGVGRGIAGVAIKPAAAAYALPAYAMMGVYKEIQKRLGEGVATYILSARIAQGFDEWIHTTDEERSEAVMLWSHKLGDVKGRRGIGGGASSSASISEKGGNLRAVKGFVDKQKEKRRLKQSSSLKSQISSPSAPRLLSVPDHANLQRRGESSTAAAASSAVERGDKRTDKAAPATDLAYESDDEDRELEEIIRLSMRIDPKSYDPELRRGIQQNLEEMRAADEDHDDELFLAKQESRSHHELEQIARLQHASKQDEHSEEDVRRRVAAPNLSEHVEDDEDLKRAIEASRKSHAERHFDDDAQHDNELRLALEESRKMSTSGQHHDDEDIRKAMEESRKAAEEEERRRQEEEKIVMEYIRKQSLAEERLKRPASGTS